MHNKEEIKQEIKVLREKIEMANKAYYVDSNPILSDLEYDALFDKLLKMEDQYPDLKDSLSPTVRVGSDIDNQLPEKEHSIPVLSLDKCYKANEVMEWVIKNNRKLGTEIEVVIELKIDGAGVVLYYENGLLDRALTRGNGYIGNDITENIKTIKHVPLKIDSNMTIALRGEVFINKNDFIKFNEEIADSKYSNPRNLASGCVRRLKSKETAMFPLNIFIYEGFSKNENQKKHLDILIDLKKHELPVNDYFGFFSNNDIDDKLPFKNIFKGNIDDIPEFINKISKLRNDLPYEIDGLVIKINDIESRKKLGYTHHHPRWAIAYKFEAPFAETIVKSIDVQIGRGGRATPVANLEPVFFAGSTISRATLHNQDYIDTIGVNIDDRVTISKRGDVIPAVEEVVEKGKYASGFQIAKNCPVCKNKLEQDGSNLFCNNKECDARLIGTLKYFVSRPQMDIDSLGDKTIEFLFNNKFIRYIPDIYNFNYKKLLEFEGYKEKKVQNIIDAVEKSKNNSFKTVLSSIGLKDIGNKVSELLVNKYEDIDRIIEAAIEDNVSEFLSIDGIGDEISKSIIKHFTNPDVINIINELKKAGIKFKKLEKNYQNETKNKFIGTKWVITGSFKNFKPRDKAGEIIKEYGGEVSGSISGKTTFLLCGESPGSKLNKANEMGVKIISEEEFMKMIND